MPELFAVAAEQYLPVVDAVDDPAERRRVVGLLRRAAGQAALTGDHALVNALLTAALRLVDPAETATLVDVHTARHAALYGLGRLDDADEEYRAIEGLCRQRLDRADATGVQVSSLTHRSRFAEAIGLGVESLRAARRHRPGGGPAPAELDRQFARLHRWLDHPDGTDDLTRPEITDPALLATSRLLNAVMPAAYFAADHAMHGWLGLEALRIWVEHGPGRALIGPAEPCRLHRRGAARRLPRRVPGGAAHRGAGRGPRLRARHFAGALMPAGQQPAGSNRSKTVVRACSTRPGRADRRW